SSYLGELLPVRFQDGESFAALPVEVKQHASLRVRFGQGFAKRADIFHRFSVNFGDDIFALDALGRGDAVIGYISYDYPVRITEAEALCHFFRNILDLQSQFACIFWSLLLRWCDLVGNRRVRIR